MRVPVFPIRIMSVLPIVSGAEISLTKSPSFFMRYTEYARERVTVSGRPSGMATIIIVKNWVISSISLIANCENDWSLITKIEVIQWTKLAAKIANAAQIPHLDKISLSF